MASVIHLQANDARSSVGVTTLADDRLVSMSESLARGLVLKLTTRAKEKAAWLKRPLLPDTGCQKRAASYRACRNALRKAISEELIAFEGELDPTGKSKASKFLALHWGAGDSFKEVGIGAGGNESELALVATSLEARTLGVSSWAMATISNHALQRLFYRLKTSREAEVLDELSEFAESVIRHYEILIRLSPTAELLMPSKRGAFVVATDLKIANEHVVKTWMTDKRMEDNMRRLHAVAVARRERGVVVNHAGVFAVLSGEKMRKELGLMGPGSTQAAALNRICDRAFPDTARLPADWRFMEPEPRVMQLQALFGVKKAAGAGAVV